MPMQRLRSLKANAPIARVCVFPVSAYGHLFSKNGNPLAQLSLFLSLLRERNSGAAGPSQRVRAISLWLSTCVPRPLISPVCFTQEDQRPSSAVIGLVYFGASEEVVTIEDVIADDSMSLAASDAEEWGGSSGEPKILPPSQTLRPKPDAELIRVLSKAVDDLVFEWSAPEKTAHCLLDEWYLPGSRQQSSRQRPIPFLPTVHDELTKTWRTPHCSL